MKVTHCCVYYSSGFKGGIQSYIENVVREQRKKADAEVLATTSYAQGERAEGVTRARSYGVVFRTPVSPTFPLKLRSLDSDVIHFHSPNPLIDFSALTSGKRYAVTVHNTFPAETAYNRMPIRLAKTLLRRSLAGAGKVIVYDSKILGELFAEGPLLREALEKTVEIPPGLDRRKYANRHMERNGDVLFVAHVRPEKGLHVLVEAFRRLKRRDSRLVVMVKVSYFREYFNDVIAEARKLLGDRLVVVEDPTDEQIIDAYNTCGCVACPSVGLESWNFVLMEAASCGAPIVRTDLDGMGWLKEGSCEVAVAGDPDDLAGKIDMALEAGKRLGSSAEKTVEGYSWEDTADRLIRVYEEVRL